MIHSATQSLIQPLGDECDSFYAEPLLLDLRREVVFLVIKVYSYSELLGIYEIVSPCICDNEARH